jgi:hypothetical protein
MIRIFVVRLLLALAGSVAASYSGAEEPDQSAYPFCISSPNGGVSGCGLVDSQGNWLTEPAYVKIEPSGPYWVATRSSGLVGLLDARGKVLLRPAFTDIGKFSEDLAPAQGTQSKLYGYIHPDGSWAIPPAFDNAGPFREGVAVTTRYHARSGEPIATFIDVAAKPLFDKKLCVDPPLTSFVHGLARAGVMTSGRCQVSGVMDRRGRFVVPPRDEQYISLSEDGAILVEAGRRHRLLNAKGRTLFEVSGEEAQIHLAGEGRAFFSRNGKSTGLVDALTGKVIVEPIARWVYGGKFSEGLASMRMFAPPGSEDLLTGYLDRSGKIVIEPRFDGAREFLDGIAWVRLKDGQEGIIDRSGQWRVPPVKHRRIQPFVDDELSANRAVDTLSTFNYETDTAESKPFPAEQAESLAADQLLLQSEIASATHPAIASVRRHPCGVNVAYNRAGQRIWPNNLIGQCAQQQLSLFLDHDEKRLAPDVRPRLEEQKAWEARRDAEWVHEIAVRDKFSGGVFEIVTQRMHPAKATRDAALARLVEDAGWIHGEALARIDGPVAIALPANMKLLPPLAVDALREHTRKLLAAPLEEPKILTDLKTLRDRGKITPEEFARRDADVKRMFPDRAGNKPEEDPDEQMIDERVAEMPVALVADGEDRWQARLTVASPRHVALSVASLPSAAEMMQTLDTYGFWRNGGVSSKQPSKYSNYDWVVPPQVDERTHTLAWAFKYFNTSLTGETPGVEYGVVGNVAVMGRAHVVVISRTWTGVHSESLARAYMADLIAAARSVRFDAGQGYDDFRPGDEVAQIGVSDLITGAPPKNYVRFSSAFDRTLQREQNKRDAAFQNMVITIAVGVLILLVAFLNAKKRRKPRSRTATPARRRRKASAPSGTTAAGGDQRDSE